MILCILYPDLSYIIVHRSSSQLLMPRLISELNAIDGAARADLHGPHTTPGRKKTGDVYRCYRCLPKNTWGLYGFIWIYMDLYGFIVHQKMERVGLQQQTWGQNYLPKFRSIWLLDLTMVSFPRPNIPAFSAIKSPTGITICYIKIINILLLLDNVLKSHCCWKTPQWFWALTSQTNIDMSWRFQDYIPHCTSSNSLRVQLLVGEYKFISHQNPYEIYEDPHFCWFNMIKTQWICQFWLGKSHPLHLDDVDGRLEDSETCSVGGLPSGKPSPCANRKITVRQKMAKSI